MVKEMFWVCSLGRLRRMFLLFLQSRLLLKKKNKRKSTIASESFRWNQTEFPVHTRTQQYLYHLFGNDGNYGLVLLAFSLSFKYLKFVK